MTPERKKTGFTLIELLVVLAVIASLLTLALPRYFSSLEKSREAVLQQNLALLRETLDKYYGDKGKYPDALDELVSSKYLRGVPVDPITDSNATWVSIPPPQPEMGGVYDVRSGAPGIARNGTEYQNW
ncbi:type II secretion system protein [Rhodoferax ferrireducens]|uniref:type II secretion system protein n=1 Tax=Rhodoferax ferrireducens TaxID=192843 RepID=UPI000E0D5627|nr:type II secretion system protein [Rhodoferax ferrireducens]